MEDVTSNYGATWIDRFLFWDTLIVITLVLTDWLIGPRGRRVVRDKIADLWVYIADKNFRQLAIEDAKRVRIWLEKLFGKKLFSIRAFLKTLAVSIILLVIFFVLLGGTSAINKALFTDDEFTSNVAGKSEGFNAEGLARKNVESLVYYFTDASKKAAVSDPWIWSVALVLNGIFDWLSLIVTVRILTSMAVSVRSRDLLYLLVVDLGAGLLFAALSLVALELAFMVDPLGTRPAHASAGFYRIFLIGYFLRPVLLTSLAPTLILGVTLVVFFMTKLARPIIQTPLKTVLDRVASSDTGTLTLVAIVVGTLAKVVQEFLKAYR